MQLSTRGRYAVMALIDLAFLQKKQEGPVTLAEIAGRQDISLSYLEQLFSKLRKAGIVKSVRGPNGGYLMAKPLKNIMLSDITFAVNEKMDLTRCKGSGYCMSDGSACNTHNLWYAFNEHIQNFMNSVSLEMVFEGHVSSVVAPIKISA